MIRGIPRRARYFLKRVYSFDSMPGKYGNLQCRLVCRPFEFDGVVVSASGPREEVISADLDVQKLRQAQRLGFPRIADRYADFEIRKIPEVRTDAPI